MKMNFCLIVVIMIAFAIFACSDSNAPVSNGNDVKSYSATSAKSCGQTCAAAGKTCGVSSSCGCSRSRGK